ncbi:prolyl oligopeptidase family serine peptidase [Hydrotalea sp.]|uniref:alpha/beta hydrolase family protein n=1 Tax=Hydrotalea sp. TaxID=2881279 RepID=UPI0026140B4D|nr:prolyl oligopeptidase family serine peptidase [Hydrotalea sp.]
MRKFLLLCCAAMVVSTISAQKKVLNHTVYDDWQSIGEKQISNNGQVVVFTIVPQEGDGCLWVRKFVKEKNRWDTVVAIPRGYQPKITNDAAFVVCKIKPLFQRTRQAKIQQTKPENMPKDSMAIINVLSGSITKIASVQTFLLPEKGNGVLVCLKDHIPAPKSAFADSINVLMQLKKQLNNSKKTEDSLKKQLQIFEEKGFQYFNALHNNTTDSTTKTAEPTTKTDLYIFHLPDTQSQIIAKVQYVTVSKTGHTIAYNQWIAQENMAVYWCQTNNKKNSLIAQHLHEVNGLTIDNTDTQLAFVAEKDSSSKALQRFFNLYYYKSGEDSARLIVSRTTKGVSANWAVSQFSNTHFSESGKRLFFGTAPIPPPKDTTTPAFEQAALDIWHYADDDIMPEQLKNLERTLKKNYLARYDFTADTVVQLANVIFENVMETQKGDGHYFYTYTDTGRRVQKQWQGFTLKDIYVLNPENGKRNKIVGNIKMRMYPSASGKFLVVYNEIQKKYNCYNAETQQYYTAGKDIQVALYDETNDVPDDPYNYGVAGWTENDQFIWLYDRFDVWQVDPLGKVLSHRITNGRPAKMQYRYIAAKDETFIPQAEPVWFKLFNEQNKYSGFAISYPSENNNEQWQRNNSIVLNAPKLINGVEPDAHMNALLFTMEDYINSPNVFVLNKPIDKQLIMPVQLTTINPQQQQYNWGNAQLFKWKAYDGRMAEGIVYKPENVDSTKKYPMIVYFYERNNQTLYNYIPPTPTPSRLNISFYVSRGYIVFVPDIWYRTGHPGESAYDYIVSGTRAVVKLGYVDSTRIGIQGQSWGGYQTAYVITRTHLFRAAWAGAPVVNMFSAYGGIRWETGVNRQFQYEKTQSRIGADIWQRPDLYIENSPLFHLKKIQTPLVIMSNDADGAVPWYQGIEFYTAMRRLNKPVWLLVYNGEAHNLVERRNRKDIQIREQQFFDWQLKGDKPAKWLTEGIPAVLKGRDWGLEIN